MTWGGKYHLLPAWCDSYSRKVVGRKATRFHFQTNVSLYVCTRVPVFTMFRLHMVSFPFH
ncbi:uncharacterized protein GLRG_09821 [Colletotrichum graminicola M1.001]|uniref:Uncharacterized protein n=1 Tax=Colletotrichum graminicola (strain M1.001 / M2 / FGSC 10212) TaxID=645133 RepID=E3QUY9_COLGM|nr:uncharacterized protein GLRG_09821 [Colletotrichum graminicola M1.001]EFQ34677.1 hypothetical protein GLRG_09821 [Colletotrichum graminicola M1.001]